MNNCGHANNMRSEIETVHTRENADTCQFVLKTTIIYYLSIGIDTKRYSLRIAIVDILSNLLESIKDPCFLC